MATDPKYPIEALGPSPELARAAEAALRAVDEMAAEADETPASSPDESLTAWMMAGQDDDLDVTRPDGAPTRGHRGFPHAEAGMAAVRAIVDGPRPH